jgi:hypothetical protein
MLLAYIGNTLSPTAREEFDRRLVEDEVFSQQVNEAEFELIEEYSDGTMAPDEQRIVAGWITGSPDRHAQAAITAALRYSATRPAQQAHHRRAIPVWLWATAAAACTALLVTLPLLHHRQPSPPLVTELHPPSVPPQAQPNAEDTILLEAKRLRGDTNNTPAPTYTLHAGMATRIQIIVPQAATATEYSMDLRQAAPRQTSTPIHLAGLRVVEHDSVRYIEFSLPSGSLTQSTYEVDLRSSTGTYRLRFAVVPTK